MPMPARFPTFPVEFTKTGQVFDPAQVDALSNHLASTPVTDLVAISHGWNNDMAEATALYEELFGNINLGIDAQWASGVQNRQYAVLAVYWPSKRFADQELIPSGAASASELVSTGTLAEQIDDLKTLFDDEDSQRTLDEAKSLLPRLETDRTAQQAFGELVRSLLTRPDADDEIPDQFWTRDGAELIDALAPPLLAEDEPLPDFESGGAADIGDSAFNDDGAAAGLFEGALDGVKSAARRLLNLTTYWEMKARSGTVGTVGLNPILGRLQHDHPDIRMHLVGHSFGGRLVTATVAGSTPAEAITVDSMTLLQAAFSHYGFADDYEPGKDGYFRRVVTGQHVRGPIAITHSVKDKAVGAAYPLASRIAGEVAAALGDANDKYGGLGRNGAQKTPEATNRPMIVPTTGTYAFGPGTVNNINGDRIITGHGDVRRAEAACIVLSAIAAT